MRRASVLVTALATALALAVPASGTTGWEVEDIATGLDNPRGVDVGVNGAVYVAESGSGGTELIDFAFAGMPGAGCLGETGAVTRIKRGKIERVATFPSVAAANDPDGPGPLPPTCDGLIGFGSVGPSNVLERGGGRLDVLIGLGGDVALRENASPEFGTMIRVRPNGKTNQFVDLAQYEGDNDPDGFGPDSNPYGIEWIRGGRVVVDAGANALLHVSPSGTPSTLAVFPNLDPVPFTPPSCFGDLPPEVQAAFPPPGTPIPPQAVPTSVATGPNRDLFVGILTGFPFGGGEAKVYRVDRETHEVSVYADGLNHVTGIDFDRQGNLYVAQITDDPLLELEICQTAGPGSVIKIDKAGNREVIAQFPLIGDVGVNRRSGEVYVTYGSIVPSAAGGGSVAKLTYEN